MNPMSGTTNFREVTAADIPQLFGVRTATHENRLSREELMAMGITEESVAAKLTGTFKGWLCKAEGRAVGFAMGNKSTGEMWVIAALREYVGQGIGATLAKPFYMMELKQVLAKRLGRDCPGREVHA